MPVVNQIRNKLGRLGDVMCFNHRRRPQTSLKKKQTKEKENKYLMHIDGQ